MGAIFVQGDGFANCFSFEDRVQDFKGSHGFMVTAFLMRNFAFVEALGGRDRVSAVPCVCLVGICGISFEFSKRVFSLSVVVRRRIGSVILQAE